MVHKYGWFVSLVRNITLKKEIQIGLTNTSAHVTALCRSRIWGFEIGLSPWVSVKLCHAPRRARTWNNVDAMDTWIWSPNKNHGEDPLVMTRIAKWEITIFGKSTISMGHFQELGSKSPEGINWLKHWLQNFSRFFQVLHNVLIELPPRTLW